MRGAGARVASGLNHAPTRTAFVLPLPSAYFVGGGPQLKSPELVHSAMDRYRLRTQAMGSVMLDITIITKDFEKYGVEM